MVIEIDQEFLCDVLIIGTEGTGARAALEAAQQGAQVIAVTKGLLGRSGATLTADGEIDVDSRSAMKIFGVNGSPDDNPEKFALDMIIEGDYLADQQLVAIHTEEAPQRVKDLLDWGASNEGFIHAPGHSYPRGLWIPGLKIARLLSRRMVKSGIRVLENRLVLELLHDVNGVLGAIALDIPSGQLQLIRSSATVLATGGAMRIFPLTTAPEELTGDGMAMALRCGAALQDMEFPMFLPYCFNSPPALSGVIFSYDVSALLDVRALNRHGERYMAKWDPKRMEKTTRDVNAVAAAMEVKAGRASKTGGTYLSFNQSPKDILNVTVENLPGNLKNWRAAGFNIRDFFPNPGEVPWEVAPASHFWNGGIKINEQCATEIPGLFAAGEGTAGIHGANRLAGNALTMTQVWGKRAGYFAAKYAQVEKLRPARATQIDATANKVNLLVNNDSSGATVFEVRKEIRRIAGDLVGIVRDGGSLQKALTAIGNLRNQLLEQNLVGSYPNFNRELIEGLQNENALDVLESIVRASITRKESRGAMYRLDYPETNDDEWMCNLVMRRNEKGWSIEKSPVKQLYLTLPSGRRVYGRKRGKDCG